MDIAIIGAGLAGLCAARALVAAGHDVTLFDKGGGIGGRVATRRGDHGAFDHGAPLLHGIPAALAAEAGSAAAAWEDGIVGVPGNSAFARALAGGLAVRGRMQVTALGSGEAGWTLGFADGTAAGGFDAVLVCIPQPQALALLTGAGLAARGAFAGLAEVEMRPCWTVMAAFAAPVGAGARVALGAPPAMALHDAAKPGRGGAETWVIHADAGWAAAHLEDAPEAVTAALLGAFRAETGAPAPVHAAAHRWRHARTGRPLGRPCLWDPAQRIGLAGDWCLGPDAGDAVASGQALAASVSDG